eukprot:7623857-Alexandrium_andersonii.AAC.1
MPAPSVALRPQRHLETGRRRREAGKPSCSSASCAASVSWLSQCTMPARSRHHAARTASYPQPAGAAAAAAAERSSS